MTEQELINLQWKVKRAEKIKSQVDKLDKMIEELSVGGKCVNIDYNFVGTAERSLFGTEEGEKCTMGRRFSPSGIGCSDKEFDEWFSKPLLGFIGEFRDATKKKLDEID